MSKSLDSFTTKISKLEIYAVASIFSENLFLKI